MPRRARISYGCPSGAPTWTPDDRPIILSITEVKRATRNFDAASSPGVSSRLKILTRVNGRPCHALASLGLVRWEIGAPGRRCGTPLGLGFGALARVRRAMLCDIGTQAWAEAAGC